MILLAYICSDQTLPTPSLDNTALSWIHAELPWQAVECLFFFFNLVGKWNGTSWWKGNCKGFSFWLHNILSFFLLNTLSLLSHCSSWCCPPLSSSPCDARWWQWWQSCHLPCAACCGSRWAQFPTSQPGQRESAGYAEWNVFDPVWEHHTAAHKTQTHKQRCVCISL